MITRLASFIAFFLAVSVVHAAELLPGDDAPLFKLTTHANEQFDLESRRGKGWTVLYFYPKADTPGCTKQACAFRDAVEQIRALNAEIYGISSDNVEALRAFHEKYQLRFTLLSDEKAEVISAYGAKLPLLSISRRWTFVLDPDLVVRAVERDVDPAQDAHKVAALITALQVKDPAKR